MLLQWMWSTHRSAVQSSRSCGLCDRVRVAQRCEASCGLILSWCLRLVQRIEMTCDVAKKRSWAFRQHGLMHLRRVVKENPPKNIPTVVALLCGWCFIPAGRIEILVGVFWFLFWVLNFPRFYLRAEGGQGLLPWVYLTIYWRFLGRTGSGNKILFVRVPIPITQMDHRISAASLLGPVWVCEIQYTFLKTGSCSPIQCFGSMFLSKQFRTRQSK